MKVDLHCNLPYNPLISNPALAYLKGYLSKDKNIETRNIYWNVLPLELFKKYQKIKNKVIKFFPTNADIFICFYISRHLYKHNKQIFPPSPLSLIFDSSYFLKNELDEYMTDFKKYVTNEIEQKKLSNVEVAGFTMKTYQWILNYYILQQIKKINSDIITVIGGINSLDQGTEFMRIFKNADFAIWGEGEYPLFNLLKKIDCPSFYKKIPNLIYRDDGGLNFTFENTPENITEINQHPFADHNDYFNSFHEKRIDLISQSEKNITICGSRSCWWNKCKFCVLYKDGYFRERSPENIVEEIEFQSNKYKNDNIIFVDADEGRKNRKSFDKLLNLLLNSAEKRIKPYSIFAMISPIRLDRKSFSIMNKIIFKSIQIGFEAVTDPLLKKMMKRQSFSHNIQTLKLAEEQNIPINSINIIRGIPTETKEDVLESIQNLKFLRFYLNKYNLELSELVLFKDSPFYKELFKEEVDKSWINSHGWLEVKDFEFLSNANKYEIFGFVRDNLLNSYLWDVFSLCLKQYQSDTFNYNWFEYSDGSSLIEEGEKGYVLSPIETQILSYCNTIKKFEEIKNNFSNLQTNDLKNILMSLKSEGLIYFKDNFTSYIISIVSTKYKR